MKSNIQKEKASTFLKRLKIAYTLIAISYRMTSCGRFCFNSLSHRLSAYPEISKTHRRIDLKALSIVGIIPLAFPLPFFKI